MFSLAKKFLSFLDLFKKTQINYKTLSTIFYSAFLFFWIIRFFNDLWLFQQLDPPVFYTGHDLSFQLLNNFELVHQLSQSFSFSLFIDLSLVALAVACLKWPKTNYLNLLFSAFLLTYIYFHYGALGAHKHNLSGLWFTYLIFIWSGKNSFTLAFKGLRYFAIFAYASAGFWKIYRGAFTYDNFFSTILKSHNAMYMYVHPDSFKSKIVAFILDHASLGDFVFQCMTIGELLFILALFTTKFDKLLAYFAIGFHTVSYFLVNVYFYEFTLVLLPLFFTLSYNAGNNYFLHTWKHTKSLFVVSVVVCSIQLFYFINMHFLLKYQDFENTLFFGAYPFQNYMMYSYAYQSETFTDYQIYKEGELVVQQSWIPIKTEQFEGNIMQYEKILANNMVIDYNQRAASKHPRFFNNNYNQVDLAKYKDWITRKTASLTNAEVEDIEIYRCTFKYTGSIVELLSKTPVFE